MRKLLPLIIGVALSTTAPIAFAFPDPLYLAPGGGTFPDSQSLTPKVGGAEITRYNVDLGADRNKGINADPNSREFWNAGTSGVPSN